jgi:hypothetical protein
MNSQTNSFFVIENILLDKIISYVPEQNDRLVKMINIRKKRERRKEIEIMRSIISNES